MPGIHLHCQYNGITEKISKNHDVATNNILYNQDYTNTTLAMNTHFILGETKYPGYPINSYSNDDFDIYFEGRIYNSSPAKAINSLCNIISSCNSLDSIKEKISHWTQSTDGNYIIILLCKQSNRLILFNDIFGRLPLYYHHQDNHITISRDIRYIRKMNVDITFADPLHLSEYLLFGYFLEDATFFNSINKLQSNSIIIIDFGSSKFQISQLGLYNFDSNIYSNKPLEENAANLKELFCKACSMRSNNKLNLISLSGGYDSRTIAAGMHYSGTPFETVTLLDFHKNSFQDVVMAEAIAKTLNASWSKFELDAGNGGHILKTLQIKSGMVHLALPHAIPFLTKLKETFNVPFSLFTGTGGDKTLPDLRPSRPISSLDDLTQYIIDKNSVVKPEWVQKLTGIELKEIHDHIYSILEHYPESTFENKYIHFILYQRSFNRFFEGDDRHRSFAQVESPFFSNEFFNYAMNCPGTQKQNRQLYNQLIFNLHPELLKIPYAVNMQLKTKSINPKSHISKIFYQRLKSFVCNCLRYNKAKTYNHTPQLVEYINSQLNSSLGIEGVFSPSDLQHFISNINVIPPGAVAKIFTTLAVFEDYKINASSLVNYKNSNMETYNR